METKRTPEELNNPDFNYYLAYVIDPSEKDAKKIGSAMATRKNSFTQGTVVQRRLKDLYLEAVKIMTDTALRDAEFQAAKKFKLETAENAIKAIARGRGVIYKSDLRKMADASGKWLTADEIEKKIAYLLQQGAKIVDDTKSRLDFLTYDKVEKLLKTIGKNDLYDLLGKTKNSSINELQSTVTTVYNSASGKTDHKSTATNQVCGEAKKVYKNDKSKEYYDVYLSTKDIWEDFALRRNTGISEMELKEFLDYSEKAKIALKTTDVDYIEVLLAEGLNNYRISVAGGDERGIDLEDCPYCGKAYAHNDNLKACPHCHKPLEILCWNCGGKAPYTVKKNICPTCGASKEHETRFDIIDKKIGSTLVQPGVSITDIKTELNNLKNILPDFQKVGTSKLTKKVKEYQEIIDKKEREEETVGKSYKEDYDKIQELVNLKKYMTASGAVAALKNKYPTYNETATDALSNKIARVMASVKQHIDKAKIFVSQNNEEMVVNEVAAALDLSADYIDAVQIISKFPPRMPESVNTVIKDKAAQITWGQNRPQKLATYTVIRKTGSRPTAADGEIITSGLGVNSFEDTTIFSNTPYYYAVFSSRLGVNSSVVCSATPVVTYFDVSNIRQENVFGKIIVKWEMPVNAHEVEVIKKKGQTPPAGREDGQKITVKNNEMFEDGDCDKIGNSYLFICSYQTDKGVVYSKGVRQTFKEIEEIKPLLNEKIEQSGATSFILHCNNVTAGKRGIYYGTQKINCKHGVSLNISAIKNAGDDLKEANLLIADETTASFNLPPDKTYYVYPVIYNEQLIIVSKPVMVSTMIGISQMAYTQTESEVMITGKPHQAIKTITAKISNKTFPANLNSDGDSISISKDDFDSKGGFHIKLKMNTENYIVLFTELESEGVKFTTFGVSLNDVIITKEKITVLYAMKVDASATKPFVIKINFQSDSPVAIPALMLVQGSPRPLTKNDGQLVDRTPALELKKGLFSGGKYTASTMVKSPPAAVNAKFALFPLADNGLITFKEVKSL